MSANSIPPSPTIISPTNGTAFPDTATKVTLSWSAVAGAGTYSVRARNLTNPELLHPGNNCQEAGRYLCIINLTQTSFEMQVQKGHTYIWSVQKVVGTQASAPATAAFRVGESDAAEIVRFYIPEIVEPGVDASVSVTVVNRGSTTWTPEAGYRLGSQNPQGNQTWGTNRINMMSGSCVAPGQHYTFSWPARAPSTPGAYNFQWRMVREGVRWFGSKTPNHVIHVKSRADGGAWLKRDTANGKLLRPTIGDYVTLRGGHYHLFETNSQGDQKLVYAADGNGYLKGQTILKEYVGVPPCPAPNLPASTLIRWPVANGWTSLFNTVRGTGNNLLRVFLMNGFGIKDERPLEVYPFNYQLTPFRWKVRDAIANPTNPDMWNKAFFTRLRNFATKAQQTGVFLQLALFNYYELSDAAWPLSIWNPARSTTPGWATANLVNPPPPDQPSVCTDGGGDAPQGRRYCYFIQPPATSGLRNTQEQFVRKVVRELAGFPNIILEVMNEPHRGTHQASSQFASAVIGWIIDEGKKQSPVWRPLISVNADRRDPARDKFDVDWWKENSNPFVAGYVKNYEEIDIISYHGLSGYGTRAIEFQCPNAPSPETAQFFQVDMESIRRRFRAFYSRHPAKALMMSTDAVRVAKFVHVYGQNRMDLSEGQITTNLPNLGATANDQNVRSDVENWAFWCFRVARENTHAIHFQHHATFEAPYAKIQKGWQDAFNAPAAAPPSAEAEPEQETADALQGAA